MIAFIIFDSEHHLKSMTYKIVIADDHQLVLEGILAMLKEFNDFEVAATANDGQDAIQKVRLLRPDLVLMDIEMPRMNGIEAATIIKREFPEIKILFLSMHFEKAVVKKVMQLGANGFVIKSADKEEFQLALKKIISGKNYFCSEITESLADNQSSTMKFNGESSSLQAMVSLTDREKDVLSLVAEGLTNKEIGEKLFISHRTVDTHRTNLMKKLDIHSMAELIRFAYQNGLVAH